MPVPQPVDPLDDLITRFVASVNEFLFMALEADVEPPAEIASTGNPFVDISRGWEELKRLFGRIHEVLVGAEPEVDERLQAIIETGSDVTGMTEDPYIVGPVEDVVRLAEEHRVDIGNIIARLGNAKSLPAVIALFAELAGFKPRVAARLQEIRTQLEALTAYYILGMPPQGPAA